jgi:MFS family permease
MLGPIMGPTVGGWLTENYSWRWVFYINLPFGLLAAAGLLVFLPSGSGQSKLRFDWLGFAVLTVAIVNLAIGRRTFAPSMFGKVATATYILTAVCAMLFNYLGYHSVLVDAFIWASLGITLVSALHYIWHARRIIESPSA